MHLLQTFNQQDYIFHKTISFEIKGHLANYYAYLPKGLALGHFTVSRQVIKYYVIKDGYDCLLTFWPDHVMAGPRVTFYRTQLIEFLTNF